MTLSLAGYTTRRLLRRSGCARIYEARRERDGRRVLAKVFPVATRGAAARVHHEFRLLQALDVEHVERALVAERVGDHLVLLLDFVEGVSLTEYSRGRPLELTDFMRLALGLVETLAEVHACGIVHRDIKPSNILLEAGSGRPCLAEFGISVLLEDRRRRLHEREVLEGTMPYISPEQTGRTGREVDARSDLYSLGACFYELLTGRPPFSGRGALELVHAHLARRPDAPAQLRRDIPPTLSGLVMRLLEKSPEDRYQTADGLLADLRRLDAGELDFSLGREDRATSLRLPARLYGLGQHLLALDAEISGVLLRWRGRASDGRVGTGGRSLVVLDGAPGTGKTSLLGRLDGLIAAKGRRAAALRVGFGRFEADRAEVPYAAFVQAFDGLLEQLLMHGERELGDWRARLSERLGSVANVVVSLVPRLGLILGELEPPPAVAPGEARNRTLLGFRRLVDVFAVTHPLVLVLEDLQWAEADSLELLTALVFDAGPPLAMIVTLGGEPRPESSEESGESGEAAARMIVEDLASLGELPIRRLMLEALSTPDLAAMLSDTLGRPAAALPATGGLVEFVARKTGRNPQLVGQFLLYLADRGLLESRPDGWHWDVDTLVSAGVPDDLLAVATQSLGGLDEDARRVLGVAASIGSGFDLATLGATCRAVYGIEREVVSKCLDSLERQGLIDLDGTMHRFAHAQVIEAGRGMLPAGEVSEVHASIGLSWLERFGGGEELEGMVFAIVDQLDAGRAAVLERLEGGAGALAELAVLAGQRALDSGAWSMAHRYFSLGVELLEGPIAEAAGGGRYDELSFAAVYGRAQTLELTGARAEAELAFGALQRWSLSLAEYGDVVARRVRILLLCQRVEEAVAVGIEGLARCDYDFSKTATRLRMIWWVARGWRACSGRGAKDWLGLAELDDTRMRAAATIAQALKSGAFLQDTQFFVILCGFEAWLTAKGVHPDAPEALVDIAIAGGAVFSKPEQASELVDHALALARRPLMASARTRILTGAYSFVWPRSRPWTQYTNEIPKVVDALLELGEFEMAGYAMAMGSGQLLEVRPHLEDTLSVTQRWAAEIERWGGDAMLLGVTYALRFAERLAHSGGSKDAPKLVDAEAVEASGGAPILAIPAALCRSLWAWLNGNWRRAAAELEDYAETYEELLFGSWHTPRYAMIAAVVEGECLESSRTPGRRTLAHLRRYERTTRKWAEGCPENFGYMHSLVCAERSRARGKHEQALVHYERARAQAVRAGARLGQGLACLRMASLAFRMGRQVTGDGAMGAAQRVFRSWGANAVVARLEVLSEEDLATSIVGGSGTGSNSLSRSSSPTSVDEVGSIELEAVLATLQLISEDLNLEEVMGRVLTSAVASAGADRGALLLEGEEGLGLVAESEGEEVQVYAEGLSLTREDMRDRLPLAAVHYVLRTGVALVLDDASADSRFAGDSFIARMGVRALLCMPIIKQSQRVGALVLENRLLSQAFTAERLEILRALTAQAASALDNARLYDALQTSEGRWRSLVSGVPDVITLLDGEGRVIFLNHLDAFGLRGQESAFIGQPVATLLDPESRDEWEAAVKIVSSGQQGQVELEVRVTVEGPGAGEMPKLRWFLVRIVAVGDTRAKLLAIATDVSARKGLEATVRQQQRLESIGTLASGVAHEINNPIQGIMNYAELIAGRARGDELIDEFAGEIRLEADRVAAIVRNLLTFSRQEVDADYELVDLREVIDATLSLARAVLRKEAIELEVELPEALPALHCRPQQIRQIIMNLVTNARDALNARYPGPASSREYKRILLRAATLEGSDAGGEGPGPGRWVRVSVEDHGTGIPEAIRAQIFDPFFTTKGRDQGTGLGLAVSHGIALEHGGTLGVESELGVGTTFHLTLPAAKPDQD